MASAPKDLPYNKPRIISVEEPSSGHYVVGVLVDPSRPNRKLAPDWGTTLSSTGMLSLQDMLITPATGDTAVDISGYLLTDVKPDDTGKNQLWFYEKLPGKVRRRKSKGVPDVIPEAFKTLVTKTTTRQPVILGTEPDSPSGSLVESVVEEGDAGSAVKSNTSQEIDSSTELIGKKQDTWGINTRTRKLAASNTIVPAYKVKDSETTPLAPGIFASETEDYPTTPATLTEYRTDEEFGILIRIEKSLVDAASLPPSPTLATLVERQSIDKWNSIQIISTRNTAGQLPAPETFSTIVTISMPNFLHSVGVIWLPQVDVGSAASGIFGSPGSYPNISWDIKCSAQAKAQITGNGWVRIIEGYQGPANANVTRTYFNVPPTGYQSVHKFKPVNGQLIINNSDISRNKTMMKGGIGEKAYTQGSSFGASFNSSIQYTNFAAVEHNSPSVTVTGLGSCDQHANADGGSIPGGGQVPSASADASASGTYNLILPPSSTPLSSGDTFVLDINIEKRRFGIWMKEVITAIVP